MFYLICYDIVCDRRRTKLANLLLDHGERIQYSTFECRFQTQGELEKLLTQVRRLLCLHEDSVRFYRLCGTCQNTIFRLGIPANTTASSWVIG